MGVFRACFRDHRRLAVLLVALVFAMKALVPAGFMLGSQAKILTVEICADASGGRLAKQIAIPQEATPSDYGQGEHGQGKQGKNDGACPFSALSMASLAGANPALLAAALIFILSLGFAATPAPQPKRTSHLRPPLRGPPAIA